MTVTKNIGFLLLSILLILEGLGMLIGGFALSPIILGLLSLLAGIFILIGR